MAGFEVHGMVRVEEGVVWRGLKCTVWLGLSVRVKCKG